MRNVFIAWIFISVLLINGKAIASTVYFDESIHATWLYTKNMMKLTEFESKKLQVRISDTGIELIREKYQDAISINDLLEMNAWTEVKSDGTTSGIWNFTRKVKKDRVNTDGKDSICKLPLEWNRI